MSAQDEGFAGTSSFHGRRAARDGSGTPWHGWAVWLLLGCGCAAPTSKLVPSVAENANTTSSGDEPALPPPPVLPADVIEYVTADVAGGVYPGLVLGLIDEAGPRVQGFGVRSLSGGQEPGNRPDARTVYEIASLTKVFTGTLLAQMSLSGEVRLRAPVSEYLPPDAVALTQERHLKLTEVGGLGWGIRDEGETEVFLHSGGTGGYSSFFGFKRPRGQPRDSAATTPLAPGTLGVVLLVNAADVHLFELGMRLLGIGRELPPSAQVLTESERRSAAERDLLHGGDFSDGFGPWETNALSAKIEAGAACVQVQDASTRSVGWPRAERAGISLQAGRAYSLVFRAWAFGSLEMRVETKVGQRLEPYTPSIVARVPAGAEPRVFRVPFVAPRDDSDSGIAFVLYPGANSSPPGTFCLDDVTLSPSEH